MKRLLTLKCNEKCFLIEEGGVAIFDIQKSDLKFDSLKFYQNIYMNNHPNIELVADETINSNSLGKYVFNWLEKIINAIKDNLKDHILSEDEETITIPKTKYIHLFDLAACAGNGLYVDSEASYEEYQTTVDDADYAVKIDGISMQPTIPDGSIALVKKVTEYNNNDIVIVNFQGDAMCKRYVQLQRGANLMPDNKNGNFLQIKSNKISECEFQGKVVAYVYNDETQYL